MAAGAWFDWNTGDLVTEARFQDIQDSIAFIYASESAANTALTNKVEGTQFYDTGADVLKIWDGSAWVAIGGGLEVADQYKLTADVSSNGDITANLARPANTLQGNLGTGVSVSSGVFSFPQTGYWLVHVNAIFENSGGSDSFMILEFYGSNDNFSSSDKIAELRAGNASSTAAASSGSNSVILDITDISNDKIKFTTANFSNAILRGSATTSENYTSFTFLRLGDT